MCGEVGCRIKTNHQTISKGTSVDTGAAKHSEACKSKYSQGRPQAIRERVTAPGTGTWNVGTDHVDGRGGRTMRDHGGR